MFRGVTKVLLASVGVAMLWAAPHQVQAAGLLSVPARASAMYVAADWSGGAAQGAADLGRLVEIEHPDVALPVQWAPGLGPDGLPDEQRAVSLAVILPRCGADGPRQFRLEPAGESAPGAVFRWIEVDEKSLQLSEGDRPVLVYNHGPITCEKVPETDPRRTRACYIHPVWGLRGEVLTDDFPRDHYHHHGVFWTWPHVGIDGREYDLWADRGGLRQQFVRWLGRESGAVAAVLGVENGWFLDGQRMMTERVWLRVYRACDDQHALDLDLYLVPVDKPITLWGAEGKSYGGLTVRFRPPSAQEAIITVPEGRTAEDLPDTPLAWADFTARFGAGTELSGAAILVSPAHPDYPPTWLTRHYGPLCVGWPGVHPKTFQPGSPIHLSYRLWIHKGQVDHTQIQQAYEAYGAALRAAWQSSSTE